MTKAKGRQNNKEAQIITMVYSTWALKQVNLALAQRESSWEVSTWNLLNPIPYYFW